MGQFDLNVGQRFDVDYNAEVFSFVATEHPGAPGQAHAYSGSEGTVFHLRSAGGAEAALKVFKHRFRTADLLQVAERLRPLRDLAGLRASERICLEPSSSQMTLAAYPELCYAQIFPWVGGVTWTDIVRLRRVLTPGLSARIAGSFLDVLLGLEARGLAHCDLSGPNVLVDVRSGLTELVDLEHFFVPGFPVPPTLVAGTPGYNLVSNYEDVWSPVSDRYAGAILLAEMIGLRDVSVVNAASGIGCYFDAAELGAPDSARYRTLRQSLESISRDLTGLLDRVWSARRRAECPPLSAWAAALEGVRAQANAAPGDGQSAYASAPSAGPASPVPGTVLLSRVPVSPIATPALQPTATVPSMSQSAVAASDANAPGWTWAPIPDDTDDRPRRSIEVVWQKLVD